MALADVLAATTIDAAFSTADRNTITASITTAYNGSATAKAMFDGWIAAGKTIEVDYGANQFRAFLNTGRIEIDLDFLKTVNFIDNNGEGHNFLPVSAITHEFVHAILGQSDNFNNVDYKGDTVTTMNTIQTELGIPLRNSYIGANLNTIITDGFEYTNGAAIDRSQAADNNFSSAAAGNSKDLLIGGPGANTKQSGNGNDFLFGGGGDDSLNGGNGTDTGVLTGDPVDYDVRLNMDGTWAVRHVRGASDEGNDTWSNIERIQFDDGETFNLAKNGLSFQADYAFVVDQTGSMGDDIAQVQATATDTINNLFNNDKLDARIGIVGFRDNTIGEPTQVLLPFTDQDSFADRKAAAQAGINSLTASGGGDFPETAFDGLLKALDGSMGDWREGAGTKRVVLFTDASAKDAFLAPTVATLAANLGASVTPGLTSSLGDFGSVDTFEFTSGGATASIYPTDGEYPPFKPTDTPVSDPGGSGTVQIFTIFVDDFVEPDPDLKMVSDDSGGGVFLVDDPTELVETLTDLIESANYSLTVNPGTVKEGNSGTTGVSYTLSRDRTDEAATVSLETRGTAGPGDVTGAPTDIEFLVGQSSKTFTVNVVGDTINEPDETFGLEITNITENATVGTAKVVSFTIEDDDTAGASGPTNRDDNLMGTRGPDNINALRGDDTVTGKAGPDRIQGSRGDDEIDAGPGKDTVLGGADDDTIVGGRKADRLLGNAGKDEIHGDAGTDFVAGGGGNDMLFGGKHSDRMFGGKHNDKLFGGSGGDNMNGENGNDSLFGEGGEDVLNGGRNNDVLFGGKFDDSLFGGGGKDELRGQNGNDFLAGNRGDDMLFGGSGNDFLNGGGHNDLLEGGSGRDHIIGKAGDDTIVGGPGVDTASGGLGDDIFVLTPAAGRLEVEDFRQGEDMFELRGGMSFEDLTFNNSNVLFDGQIIAVTMGMQASDLTDSDFM
ncbi:MAG: hypothetical protein AcusKO_47420 [Acuticoccus sp.]